MVYVWVLSFDDHVLWDVVANGGRIENGVVLVRAGDSLHGIEKLFWDEGGRLSAAQKDPGADYHESSNTTLSLAPKKCGWFSCGQCVPKKRP